ncbi:MAG: glucose-6-phosphate dehydrogenase [Planctomycetota bacterium]
MLERIIIFGATGDLTARLLLPAIAQVGEAGLLPAKLTIVGSATNDWSTEDFRRHIADRLESHGAGISADARADVVSRISYAASDVTSAADVARIVGADREPTLVYLALPSGLIERALDALSSADLDEDDAIAIEKPFGVNLESAQRLNALLDQKLHRPAIFRVDHFLSDELVQRILSLRFRNRVFEPALNCREVERVEINWMESLALEGRAGYYDRAGAMKDMIQNHLLEALTLVIMNQPARFDEGSFRGMRVEALRSITTPSEESIRSGTLRARYTAGTIGKRNIPSYVDEPGVDPARNTETYASVDLHVHSPRWENTRFVLQSGKALSEDCAEVAIHFRPVAGSLGSKSVHPNVLRLGLLEPYVRLDTTVNAGESSYVNQQLEMVSAPPSRTPYANLIVEMLQSRRTMFIRGDEAEEAWRIIDPISDAWARNLVPMSEYPAGGYAPNRGS